MHLCFRRETYSVDGMGMHDFQQKSLLGPKVLGSICAYYLQQVFLWYKGGMW